MNAPLHPLPQASGEAREWLYRDAVAEYAAILESLSVSLREAAYRGADALAEAHMRQIIETTKATAATVRELRGARR
jgi:hypothetical protein